MVRNAAHTAFLNTLTTRTMFRMRPHRNDPWMIVSSKMNRLKAFTDNARTSGAGTNLKVGNGHTSRAKRQKIFVVPLHFFGSTSIISRFGERFRDGQYSLVSFLFVVLLLTVPPPCSAICKSGLLSRRRWP